MGSICPGKDLYDPPIGSLPISTRRELRVKDSVMPAFPWLFEGALDRPRHETEDLLAYLETLGRARELAGPEGEARPQGVV